MVSFTLTMGVAILASMASAAAVPSPFNPTAASSLVNIEARQANMPSECTDYCSVSAGCVCIKRPTNCMFTRTPHSSYIDQLRRRHISRGLG